MNKVDLGLGNVSLGIVTPYIKKQVQDDASAFEMKFSFIGHSTYNAPDEMVVGDATIKKGQELRLVTGIVLEPETEDGQGDIYSEDEVRKTAHDFMVHYAGQGNGIMHLTYGHKGLPIVESYIAPVDMKLGEQTVKKGTWMMTTLVMDDTIWEAVKKGEITGYSIRGRSNVKTENA